VNLRFINFHACIVIAAISLLLSAATAICSNTDSSANSTAVKLPAESNDSNGPTILLSYDTLKPLKMPTPSFMYFIPLISPTLVSTKISADNHQQAMVISYEKSVTLDSFTLSCEFELQGNGFFIDIFDPNGVIAAFPEAIKKNAPVNNILDYIRLEGDGFGRIDVKGTAADSNLTVTQVEVHFGTRDTKSPVAIGLYSVAPENGKYKYENKYNEIVAKVAVLTFKKTDYPRMGIEVVSVNKASNPDSYIGRIKGFIVNFFIEPVKITKLGNDTMLKFGEALLNKQTSFTFPKATNITIETVVP
jgi:hypothetical protein